MTSRSAAGMSTKIIALNAVEPLISPVGAGEPVSQTRSWIIQLAKCMYHVYEYELCALLMAGVKKGHSQGE